MLPPALRPRTHSPNQQETLSIRQPYNNIQYVIYRPTIASVRLALRTYVPFLDFIAHRVALFSEENDMFL